MKKANLSSSIEPLFQKIGQLSRLQRILIAVGTGVLIIGVFIYFFCLPQFKEIERLRQEISSSKKELKQIKQKAAQLDHYRERMEAARAKFTIVSRALPLKNEVPSLLTSVSQAGKDSGLSFLLFEPGSEKKQDFYAELPLNMELSGSYHELGEFFDKLARMPRIVNVKHFKLSSQKEASAELNIDCMAETYKFVESSEKNKK